jgi:hypothetical protein
MTENTTVYEGTPKILMTEQGKTSEYINHIFISGGMNSKNHRRYVLHLTTIVELSPIQDQLCIFQRIDGKLHSIRNHVKFCN